MKVFDDDFVRNLRQLQGAGSKEKISLFIFWTFRPIIKLIFGLIHRSEQDTNIKYECYDWVIVNDHSGHSEMFMKGLMSEFSDLSNILFLTSNKKVLSPHPSINYKFNPFNSISISSFLQAVKYSYNRQDKSRKFGIWRLPFFFFSVEKTAKVIEAYKFYHKLNLGNKSNLITLCDSHWHQSIITHIFNERGSPTFTCVHGTPSNWDIFCPIVSKYILSWGELMTVVILKNCSSMSRKRIIEVGNFKHINSSRDSFKNFANEPKIEEVVFISPCYNLNDRYGFAGLEEDIDKFLNLELTGLQKGIRPYPCPEEIKFIEDLVQSKGKHQDVKIMKEPNFLDLITPTRLFVGHVSSAVSDVIIFGGLFIGVNSKKY